MIFAETYFVRSRDAPNCPIFALAALESMRRITVRDNDNVSKLIHQHYKSLDNGVLPVWGKIHEYKHYHQGVCDVYTVTGEYIETIREQNSSNIALLKV